MSKQQIFLLWFSDIWKTNSSMSLQFVGTSERKLKQTIIKFIKAGDMEYYDEELSKNKQVEKFKQDWEKETRNTINDRLMYGFYDYCYNNEPDSL